MKLRRDVALLGALGVVEVLVGMREVCTGVLPLVVEKQTVEPAVEIVVVGRISARAGGAVHVLQTAGGTSQQSPTFRRSRRFGKTEIDPGQGEQIVDRALLKRQASVHIEFAQGK